MDLHNLSDEEKRRIVDNYIHQLDQHNNAVNQSNSSSAILIFMLIIIGGMAALFIKGEIGLLIAKGSFGFAAIIFVFTRIAAFFSNMTDSNPLN